MYVIMRSLFLPAASPVISNLLWTKLILYVCSFLIYHGQYWIKGIFHDIGFWGYFSSYTDIEFNFHSSLTRENLTRENLSSMSKWQAYREIIINQIRLVWYTECLSRLLQIQSSVLIGRREIPRIGRDFLSISGQVLLGVWQARLIYRGGIIILVPTGCGEVGRPIENHCRDFRSSQASGAMRDTSFARKLLTGYSVDDYSSMDDRQNKETDSDWFKSWI